MGGVPCQMDRDEEIAFAAKREAGSRYPPDAVERGIETAILWLLPVRGIHIRWPGNVKWANRCS